MQGVAAELVALDSARSATRALRIAQLIPTLTVGGAERMLANLVRCLRARGHVVEVVSMYDPLGTWIEAELRASRVPLHFLGKRRGLDLTVVPRLARVLRGFAPDVLHTHMYTLKYALPALALRPCGVVHTVHTLAERETDPLTRLVHGLAFHGGVVPVAIGDAVAESFRRVYALAPRRVIPNGIPVAEFAAPPGAREAIRASLGIPADAPAFVSVGRFEAPKNHAALVRAFASERLRAIGAHLLLAGSGELQPEVERQVASLGAADRVHFLGVRADVPRVLAAADVFVLSSRVEGNPLCVLEAMAAGKPVVATAVGCLPELVPDAAGRLVASGDDAALEAAMLELAQDRTLARGKGSAAARFARERFDSGVMARAYERIYEEVA